MDNQLRCTHCTWRGTWEDAEAHHAQPSALPVSEMRLQLRIEEKQTEQAAVGSPHPPSCPWCGHHTVRITHFPKRAQI